jgi:hypothetical protein
MVYHYSMSLKQETFIRQLDESILRCVLDVSSEISKIQGTVFTCLCPFCNGKRRDGNKSSNKSSNSNNPHTTANVFKHRNGEGLSFGCAACGKVVYSIHQLLCDLNRYDLADWYAKKRYDCDKACGRGWTCPNPSSVKQALSEKRRCLKEKAALKSNQNAKKGIGDH